MYFQRNIRYTVSIFKSAADKYAISIVLLNSQSNPSCLLNLCKDGSIGALLYIVGLRHIYCVPLQSILYHFRSFPNSAVINIFNLFVKILPQCLPLFVLVHALQISAIILHKPPLLYMPADIFDMHCAPIRISPSASQHFLCRRCCQSFLSGPSLQSFKNFPSPS